MDKLGRIFWKGVREYQKIKRKAFWKVEEE